MKRVWKFSIIAGAILVLVIILLVIFYSHGCENQTCFEDYLKSCRKASYISIGKMTFEYSILGESKGICNVNVKLLQGDLNNQDSLKLEKKEMVCSLPLGVVAAPEADMSKCSGPLKEGLQDLIIGKLYAYIVQNFGKINAELLKV